jgi:aspartyl-tRNA synthetase
LLENGRTHDCGALRHADVGASVVMFGWVHRRRAHCALTFINLRDLFGITQVTIDPDLAPEARAIAGELRNEFCVAIAGVVVSRGDNVNPDMPTGEIEVSARTVEVFSTADTLPFNVADDAELDATESNRLKYRYLDLRRPSLQKNFVLRSRLATLTRITLAEAGFLELETPYMVKYTPGGARNFLVPSRLNPGQFYALAESPQIFKQLFMVAGMDRYFQIVRCFRDEALRQDRQPEFTQIDLEMSYVTEIDVQNVVEKLLANLWREILGVEIKTPFPRMSYDEAMARYASDKPDLRLDLELCEVTEEVKGSGFKVFEGAVGAGGIVKGLRVPDGDKLSRSMLDGLTDFAKPHGARGVAFARVQEGGVWQAPFAKNFSDAARTAVNARMKAQPGDVLLFVADKARVANSAMGAIRLHVGEKLGLIRKGEWRFLWTVDMPLFEQGDDGRWGAAHHPFTSPRLEDLEYLESQPGKCRARAYDCVLNGNEIGGGSIRIHQAEVQARMFKALGLSEAEAQQKFGFLLEAFKYGPPPHGGIAFGVDRMSMLLTGADSLRDVITFPKTQKGTDLMSEAPNPVSTAQLDELFIALKTPPAK